MSTKEKTAREMFEELGYEYQENIYKLDYTIFNKDKFKIISFYKDDKTFYKQEDYEPGDITLEELQAINKQVEELKWN